MLSWKVPFVMSQTLGGIYFFDRMVRRARAVPVISEPAMVDVGWMQELGFAGK